MANNVFDGGEGYASMTLFDPVKQRTIWSSAIIEGDRDPSNPKSGFWAGWLASSGRGWFGTLSLPRVMEVLDFTGSYTDREEKDFIIKSYPLPELSQLRKVEGMVNLTEGIDLSNGERVRFGGSGPLSNLPLKGTSMEILAKFKIPSSKFKIPSSKFKNSSSKFKNSSSKFKNSSSKFKIPSSGDGLGWDMGINVLWSEDDREQTRIGVMDGRYMPGVDLWDELNGDLKTLTRVKDQMACRQAPGIFNTHLLAPSLLLFHLALQLFRSS